MNLQSNALKFTKEGGSVKITVELIRSCIDRRKKLIGYSQRNRDDLFSSSEDSQDSED